VTVEAAVAVCGLVVVLAIGVAAVMAVVGQLRCTDAAREAARLVARGEEGRAGGVAGAIAPAGARVVVRREGDGAWVEVVVSRLGVELRARAYAVLEPGVGGGATGSVGGATGSVGGATGSGVPGSEVVGSEVVGGVPSEQGEPAAVG
jgi:hypothetical protein